MAIKADGTLWAWGRNAYTYTGLPKSLISTPTRVGTNTDWMAWASSGGGFYHLLQKKDGSIWAMDASEYRYSDKTKYYPVKTARIRFEKEVAAMAAGHDTIGVVLTRDGEVWAWGKSPGELNPGEKLLQNLARAMNWLRPGQNFNWGEPKPVIREKPWRVPVVDPDEEPAHSF